MVFFPRRPCLINIDLELLPFEHLFRGTIKISKIEE